MRVWIELDISPHTKIHPQRHMYERMTLVRISTGSIFFYAHPARWLFRAPTRSSRRQRCCSDDSPGDRTFEVLRVGARLCTLDHRG